ncbi:hypothetical protein Q1695_006527 [Nippostrongylus brasiliensis]|nr:hypothetical protein Q1695_006527 [Nippostrongylus brasiliensis]
MEMIVAGVTRQFERLHGASMKKLKRRLSAAFRSGGSQQNVELCGANGISNGLHPAPYGLFADTPNRAWSLSDSMSHLADRLAIDGVIVEECDPSAAVLRHPYHRYNRAAAQSRAASMYNPRVYSGYYGSHAFEHRKEELNGMATPQKAHSCAAGPTGSTASGPDSGRRLSRFLASSSCQLRGGPGGVAMSKLSKSATFHDFCESSPTSYSVAEAIRETEVDHGDDPSDADDCPSAAAVRRSGGGGGGGGTHVGKSASATSSFANWLSLFVSKKRTHQRSFIRPSVSLSVVQESPALGSDGESVEVSPCTSDQTPTGVPPRYIVNVKMRQKPSRKWSESEIGFGKLETYEKLDKLGEGTYATVYRGRSLLTNKFVALKVMTLRDDESVMDVDGVSLDREAIVYKDHNHLQRPTKATRRQSLLI